MNDHTLDLDTLTMTSSLACVLAALASHPGRRYWIKALSGRYVFANELFASDLGLSVAELLGRGVVDLWGESAAEIERVDDLVRSTRRDYFGHAEELYFPDGTVLNVEVSRSPVMDHTGEVVAVGGFYDAPALGAARDRAERQLRLSLFTDEQLERYASGLGAIAEEFSA